jgi:hypothetical protein
MIPGIYLYRNTRLTKTSPSIPLMTIHDRPYLRNPWKYYLHLNSSCKFGSHTAEHILCICNIAIYTVNHMKHRHAHCRKNGESSDVKTSTTNRQRCALKAQRMVCVLLASTFRISLFPHKLRWVKSKVVPVLN